MQRPSDTEILERQRALAQMVVRLADPLCIAERLELVHVEYQREPGGLTLRVYIDKPGGITLDDCTIVSRQLADILDVHWPDGPPYRLEVSSPGPDRPLGKIEDYRRFKGHRARIHLLNALNGRKKITGTLDGVKGDTVQFIVNEERFGLAIDGILKARLINYNGER